MRAEMRYHRAIQDLKTKSLDIQDKQKKFAEMQIKCVMMLINVNVSVQLQISFNCLKLCILSCHSEVAAFAAG